MTDRTRADRCREERHPDLVGIEVEVPEQTETSDALEQLHDRALGIGIAEDVLGDRLRCALSVERGEDNGLRLVEPEQASRDRVHDRDTAPSRLEDEIGP